MAEFATYEYYTESFHGSTIPSADFNYYAAQATSYIMQFTFGLATNATEAVKDACCAIADALYSDKAGNGGTLTSENVDGWSRSWAAPTTPQTQTQRLYGVCMRYLGSTGLMDCGVIQPC